MKNPFEQILLPYQREVFTDDSRFIVVLAGRQIGKSLTLAAKAVYDAISTPKSLTCIVSVNERSAQEFLRKILQWAQACHIFRPDIVNFTNNASSVTFSNGSRIITLPSNPAALRGYSGNIIWDESALCENDQQMWQAMLPIISSEMNGVKKILVSSTPTSLDTIFAKIWHDQSGEWSRHKFTVEDAANQGLKVDIPTLKKVVNDDLIWQTEYMCEFCSGAGTAFPPEWTNDIDRDETGFETAAPYLGFDVARTGDFSAFVVLKVAKDGRQRVVEIHKLKNAPFNEQLQFVKKLNDIHHFRGGLTDSVGVGAMIAEEIARTINAKIKPFQWNATNKAELHDNLRTLLQNRQFTCDPHLRETILSDFAQVRRYISDTGRISFSAPHSSDGHADVTSGICLAVESARQNPVCFQTLQSVPAPTLFNVGSTSTLFTM